MLRGVTDPEVVFRATETITPILIDRLVGSKGSVNASKLKEVLKFNLNKFVRVKEIEVPLGSLIAGGSAKVKVRKLEFGRVKTSRKFGPHLGKIYNWTKQVTKIHGPRPPSTQSPSGKWHDHHIGPKNARKGTEKGLWAEKIKDILEKHDIDWYRAPENLNWAPHNWKGLHTTSQQKIIYEHLAEADTIGKERVIEVLRDIQRMYLEGELVE